METVVAKLAGFCFGVKRAVELLEELLVAKGENELVYTLGSLIHNSRVVASLAERGASVISEEEIDGIFERASDKTPVHIMIRTHGVEKRIYDKLSLFASQNKNFHIHDLTCPFVSKIHKIASEKTSPDTTLVVFGNACHPEVKSIVSYARGDYKVISSGEECDLVNLPEKDCVIVAQTTQNLSEWKKVELFFKKYCTNAKIFDTICSVTENRQREAEALAREVDLMVVVGGKHSANTASLYETVKKIIPNVYLVEGADELSYSQLHGHSKAGITAGASTPGYIIEEVKQKMSEINEIKEENFAELLEGSLKTLNTGDIVTGVITSITSTEIHVDLSTKGTGILSVDELTLDPTTHEPLFKVGDEIEAFVVRVSDVEGVVGLSRKKIERMSEWKKIEAAHKDGTVLEGKVVEAVKGGVVISTGATRVFVPASQTGVAKDAELSSIVGTTQQFTIIDIDEHKNRAVGSIKTVLRARRKEAQENFWKTIEEGMKFEGVVKSLTSYGAFVDLGGVDGMVHITELSWSRIKNPSEVVSVGDKLNVFVKSFDKEKKRISLGCKTEENNPWTLFTAQYNEGDVASVKIVGITPFGAFAEIIPDVDGLIHISQIAEKKIGSPAEVLEIGQTVDAKIVGIDHEKKKVSLSIRALLAAEEPASEPVEEAADAE